MNKSGAPDHETISKAVGKVHEDIARRLMKDDPSLNFAKAILRFDEHAAHPWRTTADPARR
jgi:hypothetical protein